MRRYGHFDLAEDAVQEALIAAGEQWPRDGVPDDPRAWLIRVAARRLTDLLRSESARRQREERAAALDVVGPPPATGGDRDDTLVLLYLCCHPALTPPSQLALVLRAAAGLTTHEVARALLVSDETVTRRITRAKQSIRDAGARFRLPEPEERDARTRVVLRALYLVFTEGYASSGGDALLRPDLCAEAIRLTRGMHAGLPEEPEVAGLLALMLLTDARRAARTTASGLPVPMAEQDRGRWDRARIAEGVSLISATLPRGPVGPYQLQAAIAAVHDEAADAAATDWPQIVALYDALRRIEPGPVVELNRAVAVAMAQGPDAGLAALEPLAPELDGDHRYHSARAHLLEERGDRAAARDEYLVAAELARNLPQQRYLRARADTLAG